MKTKPKKIIPRKDYILVKPDEVEKVQQSEHGVYKPQNNEQEKKFYGTVVAVGKGVDDIKKGDRIIFAALAGDPIEIDKVELLLLHDEEILAFLE